ncbi:MAG TPA: hypothetical protein VIZ60_02465 [Rubrobacter sp.]
MGFEESALSRLRRYREEADRSLGEVREAEAMARRFAARLFAGLEYTAVLGRQAGLEIETTYAGGAIDLQAVAGTGSEAGVSFGLVPGAAAETDVDLMHEELSRYSLEPSGYSGRILGWSEEFGEAPCQAFAVYRDGVWKTTGLFVTKARGKVEDSDDIINGFCLRIVGRLIDLASLTGGAGRRWADEPYSLKDLLEGKRAPTSLRWPG